jgi:hypothetical protein
LKFIKNELKEKILDIGYNETIICTYNKPSDIILNAKTEKNVHSVKGAAPF